MHKVKFLVIVALAGLLFSGCLGKKKQKKPDASGSAEPDKVLYERAIEDISHNRHEVARLTLQTLINTYPDSEYLAKAKLAIADSFFKEGGGTGLKQSVEEYNNFIIFFPFLEEAAYAQMQIGLAHYRQLEKPDRDRTEARLAEDAFQVFIQKYPNSPLLPQAVQKLRDVQELLAEGDFRIAHYYYVKGSLRAAGARLLDLTSRYPLYSQADKANWMLGQVFERAEKGDVAARFYSRIVREYPLSDLTANAKERLVKLGVPVPQPDAEALARQQQEREIDRGGSKTSFLKKPLALIHSGPNLSSAARYGQPNLTPASEAIGSLPEGPAPSGGGMNVTGTATGATGSNSSVVETVVPGTSTGSTTPPSTSGTANPPAEAGSGSAPGAQPPAAGTGSIPTVDPTAKSAPDPCKVDPKAKPDDKNKKPDDKTKKACKESTSKKKSGIKKIIPW
jgi:outer membrane protein assembly factor BamD